MSGTALDHRLVRSYLRELAAALGDVPAAQARELTEQITAHLEEALPPDAGEPEVAAALGQLGSPAELAAETRGGSGGRPAGAGPVPARAGRRRTWLGAAVALVLLGAVAAPAAYHYLSARPLQFSDGADWWFGQDARAERVVSAGPATQSTAPIRSGQLQGYVISVSNPTDVTQTIVGDGAGPHTGWNNPGGSIEHVAVSRSSRHIPGGFAGQRVAAHLTFTLPVSIPPFQSRLVRVLWISDQCLGRGESQGIDRLYLRVRVGWFTRTEAIGQQAWYLSGPSAGRPDQGRCR